MGVDQSTITTAGLDPFMTELGNQTKRREAMQVQSDSLGTEKVDLAKESARLTDEKAKETAPLREAVAAKAKDVPSTKVEQEKVPEFKRPTVDPKELHESFGMLMAASMLVGMATRQPFHDAMNAMGAGMQGYLKGDKANAEEAFRTFDKNVTAIKERNQAKKDEVDRAFKDHANDLAGLQTQLAQIAAKYDDQISLMTARTKSVQETKAKLDSNITTIDKTVERLLKDSAQVKEWAAKREQATQFHNDKKKANAEGQAAAKSEDEKAIIDFWAKIAMSGDPNWRVGLGRTKEGAQRILAVENRMPKLAEEMGMQPQDIGTNKATNAALTSALRDRTKFVAAGNQFVENMKSQADLVEKYAKAGSIDGIPALSKWIQSGRVQVMGDAAVNELDVAIRGLAREHQRIVTGVTANSQLHVAAQKTADELLNRAQTPEQIRRVIGVMREEADNAIKAGNAEVKQLTAKISNILPRTPSAGKPAPTDADRAWAKSHPEDAAKFKAHFGVDP